MNGDRDHVLEGLDAARRAGWARAYKAEERVRLLEKELRYQRGMRFMALISLAKLKWMAMFAPGSSELVRKWTEATFVDMAQTFVPAAQAEAEADDEGRGVVEAIIARGEIDSPWFEDRCLDCDGRYTDTCRHEEQTPDATVEQLRDQLKEAYAALVALGDLVTIGAPRHLLSIRACDWGCQASFGLTKEERMEAERLGARWAADDRSQADPGEQWERDAIGWGREDADADTCE